MMKKLFNKKTIKLYIALICVAAVLTIISTGFCIHYSSQHTKLIEESKASSGVADSVSSILGSLVSGQTANSEDTDNVTNAIASALTSILGGENAESKNDAEQSAEIKAAESKKLWSTVITVVFAVLVAVFSAGAITCYQYEKYLESPKYKAKLKRIQKAEKIKAK